MLLTARPRLVVVMVRRGHTVVPYSSADTCVLALFRLGYRVCADGYRVDLVERLLGARLVDGVRGVYYPVRFDLPREYRAESLLEFPGCPRRAAESPRLYGPARRRPAG